MANSYFFRDKLNNMVGPITLQDLVKQDISKDTFLWREGLRDWVKASELEELKDFFISTSTPPPFTKEEKSDLKEKPTNKKSTSKSFFVKSTMVMLALVGTGLTIYYINYKDVRKNDGYKEASYEKDSYEERVMSVEEIEKSQPPNFLSASGTFMENFWGDKIKIKCKITNKATVASYKDVVIRITFYSKTQTSLGSEEQTLYERFSPTSSKTFNLKVNNYKDVASVGVNVVSAVAE